LKDIIMATFKYIAHASPLVAGILLASGLAVGAEGSSDQKTIAAAIKGGSATLDLRLRFEEVDVDNLSQDEARALTLRTRLNYSTARYQGLGATLEMDNITEIDGDNYATSPALKNSGNFPGKAIIADPEGTEVNQAYISYKYGET
jgi:hypothetical protein